MVRLSAINGYHGLSLGLVWWSVMTSRPGGALYSYVGEKAASLTSFYLQHRLDSVTSGFLVYSGIHWQR